MRAPIWVVQFILVILVFLDMSTKGVYRDISYIISKHTQ